MVLAARMSLWPGDDLDGYRFEVVAMSGTCPAISDPRPQNAGLHHVWESVRGVLFTYFWWTLGGASAGGLYGMGVAALHWVQTGRSDIFTTMPQPLMWLGAMSGGMLATAVVLGKLGEPVSPNRHQAGSR
jgi:hypothetical protein